MSRFAVVVLSLCLFAGAVNAQCDANICDGAINSKKIKVNAVVDTKIAKGAVTANKIKDLTITNDKFASEVVVGRTIAPNAVTSVKIIDGAVIGKKIADKTIPGNKIPSRILDAVKIAVGGITKGKLAANTVQSVAQGAVTGEKIGAMYAATEATCYPAAGTKCRQAFCDVNEVAFGGSCDCPGANIVAAGLKYEPAVEDGADVFSYECRCKSGAPTVAAWCLPAAA